jgi:outer membrane beta-barrel protein
MSCQRLSHSLRAALACALLCALLCAAAGSARAADVTSERGGELYSIEKRDLMGRHELAVLVGALPLDAFAKGLTLQGSYTYHFSHLIAWDLVSGTYSFNFETGLEEELRERFDVQPEKEPRLLAFAHSNFVLKPMYGKIALLNDKVATGELFFVVGPCLGFYEGGAVPFGFDYGAGLRLFVGQYFSVRFDIRNYMLLPDFTSLENHLYLSLGLSLTFGFPDQAGEEE